jgi:hypothetical protein
MTDRENAISWPDALYDLIGEPGSGREREVLEVCVEHQGQHVRHGPPFERWCQSLPPPRDGPRPSRLRHADTKPPIVAVQLDEDRLGNVLADGVVAGFRRARVEQRRERRR